MQASTFSAAVGSVAFSMSWFVSHEPFSIKDQVTAVLGEGLTNGGEKLLF